MKAAHLRAGGSGDTTSAIVLVETEASSVETGDDD